MIVCAKNYSYCVIFVQAILKCNRAPVFGRPLQVTVRLMLWDRCLVYLSVTLVYCGQTVGWIKMPLGTDVGLFPCDTVLDGDPAPLTEWGTAAPHFLAMSVLAKRSPISSTAELLFETQRWIHTVNTSCDCLCHRRRNRFGGATRLTLTTTAHVLVFYLPFKCWMLDVCSLIEDQPRLERLDSSALARYGQLTRLWVDTNCAFWSTKSADTTWCPENWCENTDPCDWRITLELNMLLTKAMPPKTPFEENICNVN